MKLSIGDKVKFSLGHTPFIGTILFAVTTEGVAVQLLSGTEIIINLNTIERVVS